MMTSYELFYWPTIQGRGEFVRLALEDAGAAYTDVARRPARDGGGAAAMMKVMHAGDDAGLEPFAPPFLRVDGLLIAQTANILAYLGPRLGLIGAGEPNRVRANQLQLTLMDLVAEVHDAHHPVAAGLYYDDQKPEAKRAADALIAERLPKFLGYFERALEKNAAGRGAHLVGAETSYPDLSLFQLVAGLRYAFARAMEPLAAKHPRVIALHDRVAARPRIAAYLASERRLPFNEDGIFRHYPELDVPPPANKP